MLDFMNNPDAIQAAFEDYYQTTILAEETDPDKLHDLRGTLDQYQIYSWEQIDEFVEAFLNGADRSKLDPGLDICVEEYQKLDEDGQVEFKSSAKAFGRLYSFLSQVLPYGNTNWEKLSIFLSFLNQSQGGNYMDSGIKTGLRVSEEFLGGFSFMYFSPWC